MFELSVKQMEMVDLYFSNNAKKLNIMVDMVLSKLHFININKSDYYSLANEIFFREALLYWDESKPFQKFLYSCLYKKFCTDMTNNTRDKRCTKARIDRLDDNGNVVLDENDNVVQDIIIIPDVCIDSPISDDDGENATYGDLIADPKNVENQIFDEEDKDEWHVEVKEFLKRLSPLQRKIILKIASNYTPDEICSDLHITKQHYTNSIQRIYADEKISILRPLVERKDNYGSN